MTNQIFTPGECNICGNEYDENAKIPMLSPCKHNGCKECWNSLQGSSKDKCPFCCLPCKVEQLIIDQALLANVGLNKTLEIKVSSMVKKNDNIPLSVSFGEKLESVLKKALAKHNLPEKLTEYNYSLQGKGLSPQTDLEKTVKELGFKNNDALYISNKEKVYSKYFSHK